MNNFDNAFDKFILRDDMTIKEIFKAGWDALACQVPPKPVPLTHEQVLEWCKDKEWRTSMNVMGITPPSGWMWYSCNTKEPLEVVLRCPSDPTIPDVHRPSPTVPLTRWQVLEDATVYLHDWPLPNFKPVTRYQGWTWRNNGVSWTLNAPNEVPITRSDWWALKCQP